MRALKDFAAGKLVSRESLIREIQERVKAELVSDEGRYSLNGPLGEQIAIASGNYSPEFCSPEEIAEGICTWLEQTFLNQPLQGFGPRGSASAGGPPESSDGGGDGLPRVAAPTIHLPRLIAEEFGTSTSEARRLLHQGGVAIDGVRVEAEDMDIAPERIDGAELRIGRRRGKRINLTDGKAA